ncbi:MAG: 4-hydroxybenzoate octaprenyltransferase [Rhodospirillaceae bacterium]|nr:4-hydroxybenzoate octaprenyltransferase [Rhodospirillaceae bacterium]MYF86807.1 4-hydroxybenzoate octaprenyltransferase [Rhodospirillaceae bacterium]MYH35695.1 4-hydroxybenzoate octaprenyltransferase [Rhodospirillaceae bacterium]MYK12532.1 4-hydroxybenzoate octaprenyltransferase [Rhodospirillaceae bacterium]MYK57509.1 4-hydroxybenzoate octaprenyltransferase [Rhodospirillaceae bacterium]
MSPRPERAGLIAGTDMPAQSWIDRLLPRPARPYARLMRLDRPIGTWLLLFPGWWSIALAFDTLAWTWDGAGRFLWFMALFGAGALLMRGAGCTWNDITDREFDAMVERTRTRPIPSGQVSVRQALAFMMLQMAVAFGILLQFNGFAVLVGAASLAIVFVYPLMKRVTYWPQIVLGLAFNWGALLGWAAVRGDLGWPPVLLYIAGIFWTLGYDTIYAHQDKEDDILIGVKSSALKLGANTRPWLWFFYGMASLLIAAAGWLDGLGSVFWIGFALGVVQLGWQAAKVDIDDPADCLRIFKSNRVFGWCLLLGLTADLVYQAGA